MRYAPIFIIAMLLLAGPLMVCLVCTAAVPVRVQATIYSADFCKPCDRYIAAVRADLPRRGLIVRDAGAADVATADVVITKKPVAGIDGFPTTIIRRDGREVRRIVGEMTPAQLIDALNN